MTRSASALIQNWVAVSACSLAFDRLETPSDQWLTNAGPQRLPSQVGKRAHTASSGGNCIFSRQDA